MSNGKGNQKAVENNFLNAWNHGKAILADALAQLESIFLGESVVGFVKTSSFIVFDERKNILPLPEVQIIDWRRVLREAYDANLEYIATNLADYTRLGSEINPVTFMIKLHGNVQGFLCVNKQRDFKITVEMKKQAEALCKQVAHTMQGAYMKKDLAFDYADQVYEAFRVYLCVIDTVTNKIVHMNERAMLHFSDKDLNKNCWEVLRCHKTERCENCTADLEQIGDGLENATVLTEQSANEIPLHTLLVKASDNPRFLYEMMFDAKMANALDGKLHFLGECDYVSGFPNRNKLQKDLERLLTQEGNHFALMMANINSFRFINEGMGREQGDQFLLAVLDFFYSVDQLREKIYHLGGDEFVFILSDLDTAREVAAAIRERFREVWRVGRFENYCTIAMGISIYPKDAGTAEALINNAEIAMQTAKAKGNQEAVFFRKNEDKKVYHRLRKELMLRNALFKEVEQFEVFYHPLINTYNGKWIGAEALARWVHPTDGMISPAEFIPMAENLGIITELGEIVLQKACAECKRWHNEGYLDMVISVNLSVHQLYKKNYAEKIKKIIENAGLAPASVTFEITENIAMNDLKKTVACLNEIHDVGVSIALDDFGKGYSSLNNLNSLPIDHVKIDRSFISEIHKGDYHFFFTKTIIELAHSINLRTFIEGVERRDQWDILKKLKSDVLQGYYFGKPMTSEDFIKKLRMKR